MGFVKVKFELKFRQNANLTKQKKEEKTNTRKRSPYLLQESAYVERLGRVLVLLEVLFNHASLVDAWFLEGKKREVASTTKAGMRTRDNVVSGRG